MCLCWLSTTKINYRKWLTQFPFQSPPFWWLMPTQTKANIKCRNITSLYLWWMCIGYLELNQLKISLSMNGLLFLLFNILDHFCTTCLFLQILLENLFKVFLQIVKRYRNKIARSIFKIWIFFACFKCFSFDSNKTPPGWKSPLSVQEGFTSMKKI